MRFAAFQPHKRFQYPGPKPYQVDIPVIGGGFLIVIIGIIIVSFVWPTIEQDWPEIPRLENPIKPEYPSEARNQGISGEVVLQFVVNERGIVVDPQVIDSTPPNVFDDAAMQAVSQWQYQPIKPFGKATPALIVHRLRFQASQSGKWSSLGFIPSIPEQVIYGPCSSPPVVIQRVKPERTAATRSEYLETQIELISPLNECLVTFWVNEEGSVTFPRLDGPYNIRSRYSREEILTAIRQWKFKPAIRDGKPVSILVTQRMDLNPAG